MPTDEPSLQRILGRLEEKVDQLVTGATTRDSKLDALVGRQQSDAHEVRQRLQEATNQIHLLQTASKRISGKLDAVEGRVAKIEKPIARAVAVRASRRQLWVKVVTVASAIAAAVGTLAEPIWKAGIEPVGKLVGRLVAQKFGGAP